MKQEKTVTVQDIQENVLRRFKIESIDGAYKIRDTRYGNYLGMFGADFFYDCESEALKGLKRIFPFF